MIRKIVRYEAECPMCGGRCSPRTLAEAARFLVWHYCAPEGVLSGDVGAGALRLANVAMAEYERSMGLL